MNKMSLIAFLSFIMLAVSNSAFAVSSADSSNLASRYSASELSRILKADGYGSIIKLNDDTLKIKIDGKSYIIFIEDDGDLRSYYGISGVTISYRGINDWNQSKRLSRAYLDSDNDPILEADLLANAGISEKHVTEFFEVFVDSVTEFREFVNENDQD